MIKVDSKNKLRKIIKDWKQQGKTIAFVPTMGNLHEGHLSLIKKANEVADKTVSSIFVNPTQFDRKKDLSNYPRTLEADTELLQKTGCDLLFTPQSQDMYSNTDKFTRVQVPGIGDMLEGESRPGHFQGVATIVTKLFNLVTPDSAIFGEKDYQQLMVIKQMVRELDFNIEIIGYPIVRENDGLAMSSRNGYLTEEERNQAPYLHQTLQAIKKQLIDKEKDIKNIIVSANKTITTHGFIPDYIKILRQKDLLAPKAHDQELIILASAWLGSARLIDNLPINLNKPS